MNDGVGQATLHQILLGLGLPNKDVAVPCVYIIYAFVLFYIYTVHYTSVHILYAYIVFYIYIGLPNKDVAVPCVSGFRFRLGVAVGLGWV